MGFFKNLFSGHLLGRPTTHPPLQAAAGDEALPCCPTTCGAAAAAAADEEKECELMLPGNHPESIRVRRITGDLIAAACDDANYGRRRLSPLIRRPFRGVDWTAGVVEAPYVNGFSTATGDIWVTTGLLKYLRRDTPVAAVLAHEVGHVIARHIEKEERYRILTGFLADFAGELLDAPPGENKAEREALRSLLMRPCLYNHEYEADRLGLLLLAAAGYDPRAVPPMWRRLGLGGVVRDAPPGDVRSTHPVSSKRAERLSQPKVMNQALDLYRQAAARSA